MMVLVNFALRDLRSLLKITVILAHLAHSITTTTGILSQIIPYSITSSLTVYIKVIMRSDTFMATKDTRPSASNTTKTLSLEAVVIPSDQ